MFGRRAFSVAGPAAWNSLPDYLRGPTRSVDSFRRDLKTLLFSFYWRTQRIRGFAIMRYTNLLLTLTLTLLKCGGIFSKNLNTVQTFVADVLLDRPAVRRTTTLGTLMRSPAAEVSTDVRTWARAAAVLVLPPE